METVLVTVNMARNTRAAPSRVMASKGSLSTTTPNSTAKADSDSSTVAEVVMGSERSPRAHSRVGTEVQNIPTYRMAGTDT